VLKTADKEGREGLGFFEVIEPNRGDWITFQQA
jgi:hypothetical protein